MKRFFILFFAFVLLLSLSGCRNTDNKENDIPQNTAETTPEIPDSVQYEVPVDWSDFIKINDVTYKGDWRETEVSLDRIGAKIGEVSCGVPKVYTDGSGNVQNLEPENGASFLCGIGTELFYIIDSDNAIAAFVDGKYYLYTAD